MSYCLGYGGTERQLAEVASHLDRSRFEPHVGSFHPEGVRGDELCAAGIPVRKFAVRSFRSPSTLGAAWSLRRYLKEQRIDILHAFDVPATLFAVPTARACGVPAVLASQRAHRSLLGRPDHRLLRLTDRMAHGIVVNSRAVAQALLTEDGVPADRIHLCYNGIRTDIFFPPSGPRPETPVTIGVICVLRPEKLLEILLEAFAPVGRAFPCAHLLVIGSGPVLPALQSLARQLQLGSRCRFEPATGQVAERLRQIDIFVLPSRSESFSNSLMEAMACGCCAVAGNVGGNPELIQDGKTGLLFRSGDSADLAAKLTLLLAQPQLRRQYAAAGLRRIRETFSIQASAARMEEIYSQVWQARFPSPSAAGQPMKVM
jgi:glycosyltransferase involved in cell wall biosynthesis